MARKHWMETAQHCLEESLGRVPHELNELDWKVRLSEQKERLTEHLIAIANYPNGGCLVFGVGHDGQPEGVAPGDVDRITNTLANLGRDAIEPPVAIDHGVLEFRDVPLLVVHVPEQPVKPAHRRGRSIEDAWVRSGGTTRKASRQEIGALMLNSALPRWEELRASPLLSLNDVRELLDIDGIARLLQRRAPSDDVDLGLWLRDEGLTVPDGRGHYITNFGAVAAARRLSDIEALERKSIRVVRYGGTNKVKTIEELSGRRGYAVGFDGLIGLLTGVLPRSEIIEQALRTEVALYPEIALRELAANSLIHQNFTITGAGPMIEIFDDRIEFTSPGALLPGKRPDRLIGTTPESRNERLASSFRRYRICEERGTGFQKIVQSIELFGLPPLVFSPQENAFRITLHAPRGFANMSRAERIEACYQHAVLSYLSSSTLTNTTLRNRFKLHVRHANQITNLMGDAVAAGRIKRKDRGGGKKFAEYVPYWA